MLNAAKCLDVKCPISVLHKHLCTQTDTLIQPYVIYLQHSWKPPPLIDCAPRAHDCVPTPVMGHLLQVPAATAVLPGIPVYCSHSAIQSAASSSSTLLPVSHPHCFQLDCHTALIQASHYSQLVICIQSAPLLSHPHCCRLCMQPMVAPPSSNNNHLLPKTKMVLPPSSLGG
jgi:hypothetical protein